MAKRLRRIDSAHDRQHRMRNRHARIGRSVPRIGVDGLPVKFDSTLQSVRGPLDRVIVAAKEQFLRFIVYGTGAGEDLRRSFLASDR